MVNTVYLSAVLKSILLILFINHRFQILLQLRTLSFCYTYIKDRICGVVVSMCTISVVSGSIPSYILKFFWEYKVWNGVHPASYMISRLESLYKAVVITWLSNLTFYSIFWVNLTVPCTNISTLMISSEIRFRKLKRRLRDNTLIITRPSAVPSDSYGFSRSWFFGALAPRI